MSEVISEQDAAARKEQDVAAIREQRLSEGRDVAEKEWRPIGQFDSGFALTAWLNSPPAQGPGEVMATFRDDFTVVALAYF